MQTNVIVTLAVDGLHSWPAAKEVFPEVGFLSEYLRAKYFREDYRSHLFGSMSCEMIAKELLEQFGCEYVSVWEDQENGAEVYI
jgi:hypothetical protein